MRLISFSALISLVLLSSVALAQQSPETTPDRSVGETMGHPPPLVGPPIPNHYQQQRLHRPVPRLWKKSPRRKVTLERMRPPVHRRPRTPRVHCRTWTPLGQAWTEPHRMVLQKR